MDVTLPNGTVVSDVPDNFSKEDLVAKLNANGIDTSWYKPEVATAASLAKAGFQQMGSDYEQFFNSIGSHDAANKAAVEGAKRQEEINRKAGKTRDLEDVAKEYEKNGILGATKEVVTQIPGAIAGSAPQMTSAITGNVAGAVAGTSLFPGIGTGLGAYAGGFAALFPQFFSENLAEQAQKQQEEGKPVDVNRAKAALAAAGQAGLEEAGQAYAFGKNFLKSMFKKVPVTEIEKAVAQKELVNAAQSTLKSVATGAGKVALEESFVNPAQDILQRWQAGEDLFSKEAIEGYGKAVYGSLLQSPLGAVAGFHENRSARGQLAAVQGLDPNNQTTNEPAPIIQPTTSTAEPVTQAGVAPVAPPPIPKIPEIQTTPTGMVAPVPPAPVAPPVAPPVTPTVPVAQPPVVQPPPATPLGVNPSAPSVEQNRNRSTPASIAQMQGIAANPMYQFVGASNTISGAGAPIVTGPVKIPESHQGYKGLAVSEDGTDIPFHYGVVEAKDLLPSHNADGTPNANYGSDHTGLRAVVGNGRTAGIQESFRKGTSDQYVNAMKQDVAHGIDPKTIENMKEPVLVRYAEPSAIPSNIGDLSNTSGTLNLSTVEQAKNDANRIDLSGLNFDENGSITPNTIRQFVASMPTSERANLMDETGNTTRQAHDRLNAAIFHKAYGIDDLTALAHQSEDPEAKNVLKALSESAPQMAQLQGTNEYDIRPQVAQAAQLAVNARRNGIKLDDLVKQQDITAHPLTNDILQLFADNPRSSRNIADALKQIANNINEEVNKPAEGLFGAEPKRPVQDIIKDVIRKEPTPDLFVAPAKSYLYEGFQIDKTRNQINDEIKDFKDQIQLAQWAVDNAPNEVAKEIADKVLKRLQEFKKSGKKLEMQVTQGTARPRGERGSVLLKNLKLNINGLDAAGRPDGSNGTRYSTILHELVHSSSVFQLNQLGRLIEKYGMKGDNLGVYKDMKSLLTKIRTHYNASVKAGTQTITEKEFKRFTKDPDELLAYGLTEPTFQKYLSEIKVGKKNAFQKLVETVRKLLKISPEHETALDRLLTLSDKIFEPSGEEIYQQVVGAGYSPNAESRLRDEIKREDIQPTETSDILTKTAGVKSFGKNIQNVVDTVNKNIRDDDFWTSQRVAFVDKNSGLAKDLASQPVFDLSLIHI